MGLQVPCGVHTQAQEEAYFRGFAPASGGDISRGGIIKTATTAVPAPDDTVLLRQAECAQKHAFTALYSHLLGSADATEP